MHYQHTVRGRFIDRPNRFIAHVVLEETAAKPFAAEEEASNVELSEGLQNEYAQIETVHVKNTGRCRELLVPGAEVILEVSDNPKRKTKYDLVSVLKPGLGWVNIDSIAPNKVAGEWLQNQGYDLVRPEYTYGNSRVDFYMEKDGEKYLMEVKGCTLEIDGIGYFPDAPTERGAKHLRELAEAVKAGYHASIAFVIPMNGITKVVPHEARDPKFAAAFYEAVEAGVTVNYICCKVSADTVEAILC